MHAGFGYNAGFDILHVTSIWCGLVVQVVPTLLCSSWQDFDWHITSRGSSAVADLLLSMMRGICYRPVSVCLCSTKTTKHRNTQTEPHDSSGNPLLWCQRSPWNSTWVTPIRGRQMQAGWVKIGDFRQIAGYVSKTVQNIRMISIKVEQEVVFNIADDLDWPPSARNYPKFSILHRHSYLRNGCTQGL